MAGPNKKHRMAVAEAKSDSDISDDSENEEMDEEEEIVQETLDVEFEAYGLEGGDFDGVQTMLRQLFLKAHVDVAALADILVQQTYAGSVIKQSEVDEQDSDESDEESVLFGLTTVLNITTKLQDHPCVGQIRNLIIEACKAHSTDQTLNLFQSVLDKPRNSPEHTGLLISERMVNIPPVVSVPLFETLSNEIRLANDKNKNYNFEHYLMICKMYKMEVCIGKAISEKWVFPKPEEEIFSEEALASFEYCIENELDTAPDGDWDDTDAEGMKPYRRVLLIHASKLDSIVARVKATVTAPAE